MWLGFELAFRDVQSAEPELPTGPLSFQQLGNQEKLEMETPLHNFWIISDMFSTFFGHFVGIPVSGLSNGLPVTIQRVLKRLCAEQVCTDFL